MRWEHPLVREPAWRRAGSYRPSREEAARSSHVSFMWHERSAHQRSSDEVRSFSAAPTRYNPWLEGARLGLQVLVQQVVELLLLLRAARELQLLLEPRQPRVPPLCGDIRVM